MARLTKGDGATVSAGGVVGPSISLKEAYDSLRDVDSRGQWELQSQDPCRNSVAWWITILELAGRFRSRADHVPIITWNIGPVGLMNSFEQQPARHVLWELVCRRRPSRGGGSSSTVDW